MEIHRQKDGTRRPTTRTHTIITEAAIVFDSRFLYEAIVQHVTYITVFVELEEMYTVEEAIRALTNRKAIEGPMVSRPSS